MDSNSIQQTLRAARFRPFRVSKGDATYLKATRDGVTVRISMESPHPFHVYVRDDNGQYNLHLDGDGLTDGILDAIMELRAAPLKETPRDRLPPPLEFPITQPRPASIPVRKVPVGRNKYRSPVERPAVRLIRYVGTVQLISINPDCTVNFDNVEEPGAVVWFALAVRPTRGGEFWLLCDGDNKYYTLHRRKKTVVADSFINDRTDLSEMQHEDKMLLMAAIAHYMGIPTAQTK